ncbi:hypothetical protein [Agromyces sp. Marseille-Q5079]|uniref:hypothetical protein n=1 Tax=Agromyces sp. Marseille-Q5079 TaxID=3439059 RepID=UPI003D9CB3CA
MPRRLPTKRLAWGAGALVAGVGVLFWLGGLYLMNRVGWDLSAMVGARARVPAGFAIAILGLLGAAGILLGIRVTWTTLRDLRDAERDRRTRV